MLGSILYTGTITINNMIDINFSLLKLFPFFNIFLSVTTHRCALSNCVPLLQCSCMLLAVARAMAAYLKDSRYS